MDVLILWGQLLEELDQILICPFCCDSILDGTRLSMFWRHLSAKHFEKINENVGDMQKMAWIESQWHAALSADNRKNKGRNDVITTMNPETGTGSSIIFWFADKVVDEATGELKRTVSRLGILATTDPLDSMSCNSAAKTQSPRSDYTTADSPESPPPHATIRDRRVNGLVNGTRVAALPDTGADACFISAAFLKKLNRQAAKAHDGGSEIKEHKTKFAAPVQLASGKTVTPTGTTAIPFLFEGERAIHWLHCLVLPKCAHDLILGDAFLRATETLTTFKHRITTTPRSLGTKWLRRLNYMGTTSDRRSRRQVRGYLNGELVSALPDSGSDIMAVSAEYARRRGFWVDRDPGRQVMVQFADGSTAWTDGVVRGLEWGFGGLLEGKVVMEDFYVLEDLPVDVVFSGDFVFEQDVFGEHGGSLELYGSLWDALHLCNIRLIGRYGKDLERLEEEGLVDVTSPDAFSPLMVQRELARRDAIRDAILGLPVADQPSARQAEVERQRQWERWRTEHAERWASSGTPSTGETTGSQLSEDSTPIETSRFMRAGRWARRNLTRKVVSIPLVPLRRRRSGSAEALT